jgi:molecular chaperone GrpE
MPKENNKKKELKKDKALAENTVEELKKERDEYLEGWKRAKADLINYKNEETARSKEMIRFAEEGIIRDMIAVLDSFDLCISSLDKEKESFTKGIRMIRTQIEDVFKKRGLEKIDTPIGKPFNPSFHEAISVIDSDKPAGEVIEEVEKGYLWNGKVLRPVRVVVAK